MMLTAGYIVILEDGFFGQVQPHRCVHVHFPPPIAPVCSHWQQIIESVFSVILSLNTVVTVLPSIRATPTEFVKSIFMMSFS